MNLVILGGLAICISCFFIAYLGHQIIYNNFYGG